mmetsp:Transcript_58032/g.168209  ORF Transcript_58032/g.168209 Transcript_58032/m.168209 type:complete len:173 (-) Transcript_58032:118-636(-)
MSFGRAPRDCFHLTGSDVFRAKASANPVVRMTRSASQPTHGSPGASMPMKDKFSAPTLLTSKSRHRSGSLTRETTAGGKGVSHELMMKSEAKAFSSHPLESFKKPGALKGLRRPSAAQDELSKITALPYRASDAFEERTAACRGGDAARVANRGVGRGLFSTQSAALMDTAA